MGATNNIKEIIQDYQIDKRTCHSCSNSFTSEEIKESNWTLLYRTNNDTDWTNFETGKGRGWIAIEIELEHLNCPNNEN